MWGYDKMLVRILLTWIVFSFQSLACECSLSKLEIDIINLNSLNAIEVVDVLDKYDLKPKEHFEKDVFYLPSKYSYALDETPIVGGVITAHVFKSDNYTIYYVEKSPTLLAELRNSANSELSAFELIKYSLNYFDKGNVDYCQPASLNNFLFYSNLFLHRSASQIDYGYSDDLIVSSRNNSSSLKLIVKHRNPDKIWDVTIINN